MAVATRHSAPIHLLITDVVMPLMNGRELARRFAELRPDTRILFVSGYAETDIVQQGVIDPTLAFLPKPLTAHQLLHKARELLETRLG